MVPADRKYAFTVDITLRVMLAGTKPVRREARDRHKPHHAERDVYGKQVRQEIAVKEK
jgi:hypothetical protein